MTLADGHRDEPADVVIVGAGASGGVAALRLVEAGYSVVCLEQGRWHDRSEYRGSEADWEITSRKQWSGSPNIRRLPEDYPVQDSDSDIAPLMFSGVGGSMLLFAAVWPRMLPSDFRVRTLDGIADDWPLTYRELQPYYERVDRQFGVSGMGGNTVYPEGEDPPLPPLPLGTAGLKMARAHRDLGWHWWPATNAILSAPYRGRNPCVQRGTCMQGCNEGAKASTDLTHWPQAVRLGARLITGATVRRVLMGPRNLAAGVEWVDEDGREHVQRASVVVLAANGIGTARLLLASADAPHPDGLANSSGLVGRRLMMHPFVIVTGMFEEELRTWQGHFGATIESFEFYESDESRGFLRGAKWALAPTGGPLMAALPMRTGAAVWGPDHHLRVRERLGRSAAWGIVGEDLPDQHNRVELDPVLRDRHGNAAPKLRYRTSENTRRLLDFHIARASESLLAGGATRVESVPLMRMSGWHLLGTARMGEDPADSVLDRWNRSHDVDNLYVIDGSAFVTSGGVNPTATICALALRATDRMIARRSDQAVPA